MRKVVKISVCGREVLAIRLSIPQVNANIYYTKEHELVHILNISGVVQQVSIIADNVIIPKFDNIIEGYSKELWVARDESGSLWLYDAEPQVAPLPDIDGHRYYETKPENELAELDMAMYSNIEFSTGPIKLKLPCV